MAEAMALERFVLVGHSMGATLAIAFAGKHPGKVAGLFLADPSGDARQVPRDQMNQLILGLESDSYQRVIEGYWSVLLCGLASRCPGKGYSRPSGYSPRDRGQSSQAIP